jgi:hypothetical protein
LLTRISVGGVIIPIVFVGIITLVLNILLGVSKAKIEGMANAPITDRVHIGSIVYVFPRTVILRDVVVSPRGPSAQHKEMRIPALVMKFSVWDFVRRRAILAREISLRHPSVPYDYFMAFFKENAGRLTALLMQMPRMDVRLTVREAVFDFSKKALPPDCGTLNLSFRLDGDTVLAKGTVRKDKYILGKGGTGATEGRYAEPTSAAQHSAKQGAVFHRIAKGRPLAFDFKGILIEGGFLIDNLAFERKNIYLKLWGSLQGRRLQLNGFSFMDTHTRDEYLPVRMSAGDRIKASLRGRETGASGVSLDDKDMYIIDMDCLADLSLEGVHVQEFNFNLNGVPARLSGDIALGDPLSANLRLLFYPSQSRRLPVKNLDKIDIQLSGSVEHKVFKGDGYLDIHFSKGQNPALPLERIEGDLAHLTISLEPSSYSVAHLGQGDVAIIIDGNPHKLMLENLRLSLSLLGRQLKVFEVTAPFYGGSLNGKIWLTTDPLAQRIDSVLTLSDVDAGRLDDLLVHFAKAEGKLSGRIHLSSVPGFHMDGEWRMANGRLKEFAFFEWLAGTFHLPSLEVVDFREVSSGFFADAQALKFHDILLKSGDMTIDGYFHMDRNNLVASVLSLSFSRRLLKGSPKLRPILRIFGDEVPAVIFNFQLSGEQDAMSFQWLPSEHKQKIQERIPDFVERIIERNIDEMMEGAPL